MTTNDPDKVVSKSLVENRGKLRPATANITNLKPIKKQSTLYLPR